VIWKPHRKKILLDDWERFRGRKTAVFGLAIAMVFALAAIFASYIAPYGLEAGVGEPFQPPSSAHLAGTNDIGADIFSELLFASRISLIVGLTAAGLVLWTGTVVGLAAGYFGSTVDEVLMRITDIVLILPRLPLMIVMAAYLGPSLWTIVFVYACVGWSSLARQIRSQVLSLRESTFVEASRAIGVGHGRIIIDHILPNITGIIVANGVLEIMFAILTEAGLSFLGLGDPTHKSWGIMLYFAQIQGAFLRGAWWWILPPGMCIALLACSFNFVGTALNDIFALKLEAR
jgi:ABC-type dipeptide/oligopeptide/nickel transport system permease subunit